MYTAFHNASALSLSSNPLNIVKRECPRRIKRRIRCTPFLSSTSQPKPENFPLPKPGQVVLTPGRWADEDGAGIVESVRFVESRGTHVVDVIQLRRVRGYTFEKGSRALGKSPSKWYDVKDIRVIRSPQYLPGGDAYVLPEARDGYAIIPPMDKEAKQQADAEYKELKNYMLRTTVAFGTLGTIGCIGTSGVDIGRAFGLGALTSLLYLYLLQAKVDNIGEKDNLKNKLLYLRFAIPSLPFLYLANSTFASRGPFLPLGGGIPKAQVGAALVGLLSYKVPLLLKTGKELMDGLASIQPGTTGMVGTVLSWTARSLRRNENQDSVIASDETSADGSELKCPPALIFAGPSGSGKSTLMRKLEDEYPQAFDYSISHTTRERRDGETNGVEYYFVDTATFEGMVSNGEFIEFANVHGNYYGTSAASVQRVLTSGKICLLDLNIEGIDALQKMEDLQFVPRFVWVAPPSFEALEERLRKRGTETESSLKVRMDTAKRELIFAASSKIFDLTIINEDLDLSYKELQSFLVPLMPK